MARTRRSAPLLLLAAILLETAVAIAQTTVLPPDEAKTLGHRVADAVFLDEREQPLDVSALAGKPLVVSPIFTKCHHTCPMITANLKRAVDAVGVPGEDFNVLSLTFDVGDTAEDLRAFRERLALPATWRLVRAEGDQLHPFLESLDFRFITSGEAGFIHPNLVVVLTPTLEVARYLYGVEYRPDDLRSALAIARGESAWLQTLGPYLFLVGVLGVLATSFVLALFLGRSRRAARAG